MCEIILGNKAFFDSDYDSVISVEKGKFHFLLVEVTKLLTLKMNSNLAGKSWRGAVLCFSSTEEMSHVAYAIFFYKHSSLAPAHLLFQGW